MTGREQYCEDGTPLWEVFVQEKGGDAHTHVGSVHASDSELALQSARDVFARRGKVQSMWVVPSQSITASSSEESASFFDPGDDKIFRHPQFYKVPRGIKNL